jgi:hypothetical protein
MSFVKLSQIIDAQVLCLETGELLGQVKQAVATTKGDKIISYLVTPRGGGFLPHPLALCPIDIMEYASHTVLVQRADSLVPLDDIAHLKELLAIGALPFHATVRNAHRHVLGKVAEVNLAPDGAIVTYEFGSRTQRLIDTACVLKLEKHTLTINDDQPLGLGTAAAVPLEGG